MCVEAVCRTFPVEAALRSSWDGSSATAAIEAPFRDSKRVAQDWHGNKGFFGALVRAVWTLGDALQNLYFLPGTRRSARSPILEGGLVLT